MQRVLWVLSGLCHQAWYLQQIHWSKLLCGTFGFSAKSSTYTNIEHPSIINKMAYLLWIEIFAPVFLLFTRLKLKKSLYFTCQTQRNIKYQKILIFSASFVFVFKTPTDELLSAKHTSQHQSWLRNWDCWVETAQRSCCQ